MNRENLIYYLINWIFVTAAYCAAVIFYLNENLSAAVEDLVSFSILLLIGGFSSWYTIKYTRVGSSNLYQGLLSHLMGMVVLAFTLTYISKLIGVNAFQFQTEEQFQEFSLLKVSAVVILYGLMLLNYYILEYRDSIINKEREEEKLKNLLQETQLNLLKTQLNPHFIFNSLNSISSLTITDPGKAHQMVVKLSEFLRYSLSHTSTEWVTVKEELYNCQLFTEIEKVRFGDRLHIIQAIDDRCADYYIPQMILQPLIENAIKFGLYDSLEPIEVSISVKSINQGFEILIKNPVQTEPHAKKGKGIGVANTRKRLSMMYGNKYEFTTTNNSSIYTAHLKLFKYHPSD